MHYVYILESIADPGRYNGDSTTDLDRHIEEHNSGKSSHTAKLAPRTLATYVALSDRAEAFRFERHLESGSDRAFAKRHF